MRLKVKRNALLALVIGCAFAIGAAVPAVAASSGTNVRPATQDYGDYETCVRHCAGRCNFYGRCFLQER